MSKGHGVPDEKGASLTAAESAAGEGCTKKVRSIELAASKSTEFSTFEDLSPFVQCTFESMVPTDHFSVFLALRCMFGAKNAGANLLRCEMGYPNLSVLGNMVATLDFEHIRYRKNIDREIPGECLRN
jgi:hypothetical protein